MKNMIPRRPRLLVILLVVVLLGAAGGISAIRRPILRAAGWALVVNERVEPADVVVLAYNTDFAGMLEAADLVQSGVAPRVAVFADPPDSVALEYIRPRCQRRRSDMSIIGITSNKSVLVSFDPAIGIITAKHAWLDPTQNFVGLTYDYGRNMLYAVSQAPALNLYSVNPLTRDVTLIGQLTINGDDVSGLAYDPLSGTLYTLVLHLGTPLRTDLARVNPDNLQITVVGTMANVLGESLCLRDTDGQLNAYTVQGGGSWDSPYKASIVTIDPRTAAMTAICQTPYHTILGLAKKPGENAYFSWVNWTSHFYADVDLNSQQITNLGNSDPVGVTSAAMISKTFYVAPAPNLPPCSFTDSECLGL